MFFSLTLYTRMKHKRVMGFVGKGRWNDGCSWLCLISFTCDGVDELFMIELGDDLSSSFYPMQMFVGKKRFFLAIWWFFLCVKGEKIAIISIWIVIELGCRDYQGGGSLGGEKLFRKKFWLKLNSLFVVKKSYKLTTPENNQGVINW